MTAMLPPTRSFKGYSHHTMEEQRALELEKNLSRSLNVADVPNAGDIIVRQKKRVDASSRCIRWTHHAVLPPDLVPDIQNSTGVVRLAYDYAMFQVIGNATVIDLNASAQQDTRIAALHGLDDVVVLKAIDYVRSSAFAGQLDELVSRMVFAVPWRWLCCNPTPEGERQERSLSMSGLPTPAYGFRRLLE